MTNSTNAPGELLLKNFINPNICLLFYLFSESIIFAISCALNTVWSVQIYYNDICFKSTRRIFLTNFFYFLSFKVYNFFIKWKLNSLPQNNAHISEVLAVHKSVVFKSPFKQIGVSIDAIVPWLTTCKYPSYLKGY